MEKLLTTEEIEKNNKQDTYFCNAEEVFDNIEESPLLEDDFNTSSKTKLDRRDFVKLFGITTAASITSCVRRPAEKAIPYVNQPIDQIPGVPVFYATTCKQCPAGCGLLVKTREGRPVKIEGNPQHPINQGSTCALGQAQLQGLYHPERKESPIINIDKKSKNISWDEAFREIAKKIKGQSKKVAIFTGSSTGHQLKFLRMALKKFGSNSEDLYLWEANSLYSSVSKAYEIAFGKALIPRIELSHASIIVSIGSDFQDVGLSSVSHTKGFTISHSVRGGKKGKFIHFESAYSLTGTKADKRYVIPTGSEITVALKLLEALAKNSKVKLKANFRRQVDSILNEHKDFLLRQSTKLHIADKDFSDLAEQMLNQSSVVMVGGSQNFDKNQTFKNYELISPSK